MRKGEFQSVGDALARDPEAGRRRRFREVPGRAPSCPGPRAGAALAVLLLWHKRRAFGRNLLRPVGLPAWKRSSGFSKSACIRNNPDQRSRTQPARSGELPTPGLQGFSRRRSRVPDAAFLYRCSEPQLRPPCAPRRPGSVIALIAGLLIRGSSRSFDCIGT